MADTSNADDLTDALARVQRRARTRTRRLLPVALLIGGVFAFWVIQSSPNTASHHSRHHHSLAGTLVGLAVVVVMAGIAVLVAWKTRKRWRPLTFWNQPFLTAGLDRRDRRTVSRDLRRGTPNADPLLREVEVRTAERLHRMQPAWTLWVMVAFGALGGVNAALPGRSTAEHIIYGVTAALFVLVAIAGMRQRRRIDRFLLHPSVRGSSAA